MRWRYHYERQALTRYFAETTYHTALDHFFTAAYSQSIVHALLQEGIHGLLDAYRRELAERLEKKQKKPSKKRFHPLTKPSVPSPMKAHAPTHSPARSQSGLPPIHTPSPLPPRSVSGLPVIMRQGSVDDSEVPSPPSALAPPGRLVKSNTSGNLLKLHQKKLTTTPQVSKPSTPAASQNSVEQDAETKRLEMLRKMHSEKVEQMEHERLQRLKVIEQRRLERETRETARARAAEERAALKEKKKLDFLRKVTTEQVERARIVVRMKSLSDKRKEEQEKIAAEERERECQERKGLFAHDTRFEENMERVRQKIRSTSYDVKDAPSLSRRNSVVELHRLPSTGRTAVPTHTADSDTKIVQRSQSAGKHRKVIISNIPKPSSVKMNKEISSKLNPSKNVFESAIKIGLDHSPSNFEIASDEIDPYSNICNVSSPKRKMSSRRRCVKSNSQQSHTQTLSSKCGITETSTKPSRVKTAAVVVSLLAAAGALENGEDCERDPEDRAAQEQAKEREAALQKRIALKRQEELEEKRRKEEESKARKEQQERVIILDILVIILIQIAAKAQALLKKSVASKKERQKANRQRGKNMYDFAS